LSADFFAPPGPLGFPALDLSAVDPDETKISLFRPRRHVLRLGAIQFRRWLKRLGGGAQQARGDQNNQRNVSYDSDTLHVIKPNKVIQGAGDSLFPNPTPEWYGLAKQESFAVLCSKSVLTSTCEFVQDKLLGQTAGNVQAHTNPKGSEYMLSITIGTWVVSGRNGR